MNINPSWIIQKKRDGNELTREEIRQFIKGITSGEVADYQATAWLMAVYFRGMTLDETVALTEAMLESGERYELAKVSGHKVDKHSTGGVGDKVSLVLAPLAAACGLTVPMMSGRALGHTGGTLDKLESIPGFNTHLTESQFETVLSKVGCAMIGQSEKIAPADKKLYSLRDVTGTVECIPLIVASILSKKLAEGTQALVLDIKTGSGAFMKTRDQAKKLAKTLTQVGKKMGLDCRAVLTDMSQPLGYAVGNAIEIKESIQILRNEKEANTTSADLRELTLHLCAHMLDLSGEVKSLAQGRKLASEKLKDGSAWKKFEELVVAQNGDVEYIQQTDKLPIGAKKISLKSRKRGYITKMDTESIGKLLIGLGGGRLKASDRIDHGISLVFHRKLGANVKSGEPIATIYASENHSTSDIEDKFFESVEISGLRKPIPKLILEQLG